LREHDVISGIMQKRDEILEGLGPGDTLEAPSGIEIKVEVGLDNEGEDDYDHLVGPKSAVATQAQAYEQELMSVLLDVAEERDRFNILLWLHDGTACSARYPNAVESAVNEALQAKRRELTAFAGKDTLLPAIFEVEEIEAPDLPPKDVHERVENAGGGVVRLKDGETVVRVDPETGEELEPVGDQMLLKREHALYKVANTYVRITDDGYSIESDPFPEDQLWQKLDSSTSSTSSNETTNRNESQSPEERQDTCETAPGAESPSKEASSPDSDTSTTGARTAYLDESVREAIEQYEEQYARWRQENPEPDLSEKEVAKRFGPGHPLYHKHFPEPEPVGHDQQEEKELATGIYSEKVAREMQEKDEDWNPYTPPGL
jgi:hypothetical protein